MRPLYNKYSLLFSSVANTPPIRRLMPLKGMSTTDGIAYPYLVSQRGSLFPKAFSNRLFREYVVHQTPSLLDHETNRLLFPHCPPIVMRPFFSEYAFRF